MKLNDETFYLAQEIFARMASDSGLKGDLPELAAASINASHTFLGLWSTTQDVLEKESQKALATSTAIAKETSQPGSKSQRPAVKQKRNKKATK